MIQFFNMLRGRNSSLLLPAVSLFLVTYFAVHLMHGARGLNVYFDLQNKIQLAESELDTLNTKLHKIDARLARIGPHEVDPDLIDELARQNLGLSHKSEKIIFIGRPEKKIGDETKSLILIPGAH